MGTYVQATIAFGFTVDERDWDDDAYEEAAEPFDGWEATRDFAGVDCTTLADSQWDERTEFFFVASTRLTVDEEAVAAFDPSTLPVPTILERANLGALWERIPSRMRVGEIGWHLGWSRG